MEAAKLAWVSSGARLAHNRDLAHPTRIAVVESDLSLLLVGIQDVVLMAENMVIAAESLGMGSYFLGITLTGLSASRNSITCPNGFFPWWSWSWGIRRRSSRPGPLSTRVYAVRRSISRIDGRNGRKRHARR